MRSESITHVSFSPNGRWLATAANEAKVWRLTPNSTDPLRSVPFSALQTNRLFFAADGDWLITSHSDETTQLRELSDDIPLSPSMALKAVRQNSTVSEVSPNGKWFVTKDATSLKLCSVARTEPSAEYLPHHSDARVGLIRFSPNNRWLAICDDTAVMVYDLGREKDIKSRLLRCQTGGPKSICFSRDSRWIAVSTSTGSVEACDLSASSEVMTTLAEEMDKGFQIQTNSTSRFLLATCGAAARLWDLQSAILDKPRFTIRCQEEPVVWHLSNDGGWLLAAGDVLDDGKSWFELWKLTASNGHLELQGQNRVQTQFSPDGKWLVSLGRDGKLELWSLTQQGPLGNPVVFACRIEGEAVRLYVTPDSEWIVVKDGVKVSLFPFHPDSLISLARKTVGRKLTVQETTRYFLDHTTRGG